MSKLLEKALKDAIKGNKCTVGSRQVLTSLKNSKLVVLSKSVRQNISEKIQSDAKKAKIPIIQFSDTSMSLGKLCGLQFRVSTISFNSLNDSNIKSIMNEVEKK